jgi:hypothetical protein
VTGQQFAIGVCMTFLALCSLCAAFGRPRRRFNRHINLPPPDVRCKRNGPEAAP